MSMSRQQYAKVVPTLPTGESIASYPTYAEAQKAVAYLAEQRFPVESLTIVGTNLTSVERVTGRLTYGRVAIAGAMSGAWFGLFVGLLMSMFGTAGLFTGVGFTAIAIGAGFGLLFSVVSYALTRSRRDFTSSSQIVANQYAVLCKPELAMEARRQLINSPVGIGRPVAGLVVPATMVTPPAITTPVAPPPVTSAPVNPTVAVAPPPAPNPESLQPYYGPTVQNGGLEQSGVTGAVGVTPVATATTVVADAPTVVAEKPKIDSRWVTPDGKPKFGAMAADHPGVVIPSQNIPQVVQVIPEATPAANNGGPGDNSGGSNSGSAGPKDPFEPFAPPRR